MGLRNVGKKPKVSRMKRQPASETAEVVRAMLSMTSSWEGVIMMSGSRLKPVRLLSVEQGRKSDGRLDIDVRSGGCLAKRTRGFHGSVWSGGDGTEAKDERGWGMLWRAGGGFPTFNPRQGLLDGKSDTDTDTGEWDYRYPRKAVREHGSVDPVIWEIMGHSAAGRDVGCQVAVGGEMFKNFK